MPARRVPSGGLAALAVVLAALAVLVVAGAHERVVRTTVLLPAPSPHGHVRTSLVHGGGSGAGVPASEVVSIGGAPGGGATPTTVPQAAPSTTSTTTLPASTTTSTAPTPASTTSTTTTTVPATSMDGWFPGGGGAVTTQLAPVTAVSVRVPPGVEVSLVVTCGLATGHATSVTQVTVRLEGGGASCVARFSVPATTPRPARWRLAAA